MKSAQERAEKAATELIDGKTPAVCVQVYFMEQADSRAAQGVLMAPSSAGGIVGSTEVASPPFRIGDVITWADGLSENKKGRIQRIFRVHRHFIYHVETIKKDGSIGKHVGRVQSWKNPKLVT